MLAIPIQNRIQPINTMVNILPLNDMELKFANFS